jgi:hypothetical protein
MDFMGKFDDPYGLLAGGLNMKGMQEALSAAVAAATAPPTILASAPGGDVCTGCGGEMIRGRGGLEYVCEGCGAIVEGDTSELLDDDGPRAEASPARLRIVGPGGSQFQPDLYRSGPGNTPDTQKHHILKEYTFLRQKYMEVGGRAIPFDALSAATELYHQVQLNHVKRSKCKKEIMASCLYHACLSLGFTPGKVEISKFMGLQNRGIARGDNFIRKMVASGEMNVDVNIDPCRPEITMLFAHLGYEGPEYDGLRETVYKIIQIAIANNIGTTSFLRSKVAGATFVVLQRCTDTALVSAPPKMREFCGGRIRANTVERFTGELDGHHRFFAECYAAAGLNSDPPQPRSGRGRR